MVCKQQFSLRPLFSRFKKDALSASLFLTASVMLVLSLLFYLISVFSV